MPSKPKSTDEHLAGLPDDQRVALEKLRKTIRAAAPKAEECISYGLPAFRQDGPLVAFSAWANHLAFYPMSSKTLMNRNTGYCSVSRFRPVMFA